MSRGTEPDRWLGGRLLLHQPERGAHRAGTDAILLANLFALEAETVVYDLGAGTGAIGLACAALSPRCRTVLVERDPALVALSHLNVRANGFEDRVDVIEADLLLPTAARRRAGLASEAADAVVTNPPYLDTARHRASPKADKASAHMLDAEGLDRWLRTCADLLRPGGRLGLIHRPDGLGACLDALRNRFGQIALRPVHAEAGAPAIRILVTAHKGSRGPLSILPALVLHGPDGTFTAEARAMHAGVVTTENGAPDERPASAHQKKKRLR